MSNHVARLDAAMNCDLKNSPVLSSLRWNSKPVEKVGMLPFYRDREDTLHFLVYVPKNKDKNDTSVSPYQLARGTIEPEENRLNAAKREANEELGLWKATLRGNGVQFVDAGELIYHSDKKGDYGIHFFGIGLEESHANKRYAFPRDASHKVAEPTRWVTLEEVENMAKSGTFKSSYLPILRAMDTALRQLPPPAIALT